MAHPMSADELRHFLTSSPPHTAICATVRADGRPHAAPIWYAVDDDGALLFNTGADTAKGRNLTRDPRVTLCIDDEAAPFSFASIEGTAELIDDLSQVKHWAGVIGGRYLGSDHADEMAERNGVPGELLVRVMPANVVAIAELASD